MSDANGKMIDAVKAAAGTIVTKGAMALSGVCDLFRSFFSEITSMSFVSCAFIISFFQNAVNDLH
jgi:hypothetical protein